MGFKVLVDDNFHYMDESERYTHSVHAEYWEAKKTCIDIVDVYLVGAYEEGMSSEELYTQYTFFGEDPFISPQPPMTEHFSAWRYAKYRSKELCGEPVDWAQYQQEESSDAAQEIGRRVRESKNRPPD